MYCILLQLVFSQNPCLFCPCNHFVTWSFRWCFVFFCFFKLFRKIHFQKCSAISLNSVSCSSLVPWSAVLIRKLWPLVLAIMFSLTQLPIMRENLCHIKLPPNKFTAVTCKTDLYDRELYSIPWHSFTLPSSNLILGILYFFWISEIFLQIWFTSVWMGRETWGKVQPQLLLVAWLLHSLFFYFLFPLQVFCYMTQYANFFLFCLSKHLYGSDSWQN